MYPSSTQRKHWTFSCENELDQLRKEANSKFIADNAKKLNLPEESFLTVAEERSLLRHYEYILKEFCARFQPPVPRCVVNTAMIYMKRVFLHHSIMDYHPREMMLACVYLSCKVEEFNVSITQFVSNLKGDRNSFADLILGCELLLMQLLHYHLTIHSPSRPLEGFIIDAKTRCPEFADKMDSLRKGAESFIDRSLNSDVCLLFSPSQVALAGLLHSAKKASLNLDSYVTKILVGDDDDKNKLPRLIEQIKKIRHMVGHIEPLDRENVRKIEQKLDKCRNAENNPSSEVYKRKMEEKLEESEERQARKRQRLAEQDKEKEREVLGLS
ncbi:cyclin-H-like [Tubulanus polymorphus]|uniref:cyclin-H-like n=1 Tax=Tubulanus polymorphus TaxID=672921 RepID=UPI003DA2101E